MNPETLALMAGKNIGTTRNTKAWVWAGVGENWAEILPSSFGAEAGQ